MAGDIVNLRQFRKQKARAEKGKQAQANRAVFGRPRSEKERERAERAASTGFLDGHRRRPDSDKGP
jgi:hypothetical protein